MCVCKYVFDAVHIRLPSRTYLNIGTCKKGTQRRACDRCTKPRTEVCDLGIHVRVEQHVLGLEVSVHHHVSVAVVDC